MAFKRILFDMFFDSLYYACTQLPFIIFVGWMHGQFDAFSGQMKVVNNMHTLHYNLECQICLKENYGTALNICWLQVPQQFMPMSSQGVGVCKGYLTWLWLHYISEMKFHLAYLNLSLTKFFKKRTRYVKSRERVMSK